MNQEITDQTHCIIMKGGYRFWVSEKQADEIGVQVEKGVKFVRVKDSLLNTADIELLAPRKDIEWIDRSRKGDYYCEDHKQWIGRGKTCGYC